MLGGREETVSTPYLCDGGTYTNRFPVLHTRQLFLSNKPSLESMYTIFLPLEVS